MVVMPQEAACTSSLVCQALPDRVTTEKIYILKQKVHNIHSGDKRSHKAYWCGLESVRTVSTADFLRFGWTIAALATKPPIEWPTKITLCGKLTVVSPPSLDRASRDS